MADELETTEPVLGVDVFPDVGDRPILTINDFDQRKCTCGHSLDLHDRYLGCKWEAGEQECSCEKFNRAHLRTRRPACWCYSTPLEGFHPDEAYVSTTAVQRALDGVRDDMVLLELQLKGWENTEDLNERVENWRFNTWRHMEEILRE